MDSVTWLQVWGKQHPSAGERQPCSIYKLWCLLWSGCPKGVDTVRATAQSILKMVT